MVRDKNKPQRRKNNPWKESIPEETLLENTGVFYRDKTHSSWVNVFISFLRYHLWMGRSLLYPDREALVITKKLLQELFPRFVLSLILGSNTGPTFMT